VDAQPGALGYTPRPMRPSLLLALLSGLVLSAPLTASAQGNYRGSPQGGRSALMGGTGVALGRDGSIPFLNPAGLTRVETGTVSFSTNFFSFAHTRYDRFFQPRRDPSRSPVGSEQIGTPSYSQNKLDGVPSTLCLYFRVGKRKPNGDSRDNDARQIAAACFGTTERTANDGTALQYVGKAGRYDVAQTQTFNRSFRRFLFGPTYALRYKSHWSFGAALHLVATSYSAQTDASNIVSTADNNNFASTLQANFNALSYDVALRVGASYKADRHVTFGLSAQLPAVHAFGRLSANTTTTQLDGSGQSMVSTLGRGSFRASPPPSIAMGFGIESWPMRVESDLFVYFPIGPAFKSQLDVTASTVSGAAVQKVQNRVSIREEANAVIDAALGVERYLGPSFSVLAGFSTDFSANPPLAASPPFGSVVWSRNSRAAVSLGCGSYGGAGELLFGTELSYAQGKAYAADAFGSPNQLAIVNQTTWTALFVLAGKTSFAQVRKTVDRIRSLTLP